MYRAASGTASSPGRSAWPDDVTGSGQPSSAAERDTTLGLQDEQASFPAAEGFRRVLQQRVDAWLASRPRRGDPRLLRKGLWIATWFLLSYLILLFAPEPWLALSAWLSLAFAAAALGFNVFHDANHGAYLSDRKGNVVISLITSTVLGVSRTLWHYKHNVYHHTYTNIEGLDDDLQSRGFLRFSPWQPWQPKYAWQHFYTAPTYALSTIEWFFVKDFRQYFSGRMTNIQLPSFSFQQHLEFWGCKFIYLLLFVFLPFQLSIASWVLAGLILFHVSFGMTLSFIFQLAHLNQDAVIHPEPRGQPCRTAVPVDWATNVMLTTVDFGHTNGFLNWFAGGLNYQIEHHLFPRINHTYYPELVPLVRQTADEFGLPYHYKSGWLEMIMNHFRYLSGLSKHPKPVSSDCHSL